MARHISIPEEVFDEYDFGGCSLNIGDFENNIEDKQIENLIKQKKFIEISDAFDFVSGAGYGENEAILDRKTGQTYLLSDYCDIDEMKQLADEDFDSAIHIHIPHKNDLDLGSDLVFEFIEQFMPDDYDKVSQIFRKKGAYSRYKAFLDSNDKLDQWYDFENQSEQIALIKWCKENDIDLENSKE